MEITTLLEYSERSQLRVWLQESHSKEKECWVVMSRSKTPLLERQGRQASEELSDHFGTKNTAIIARSKKLNL